MPQVLLRDAVRAGQGLVPEGYTPTEMLLLARSSLPNHRALAMRMLADVLRAARPSHSLLTKLPHTVPLPPDTDLSQPGPQQPVTSSPDTAEAGRAAQPPSPPTPPQLAWHQVWRYVVHDLAAAAHVRLALDDECAPVAAAAAGALAAMICPSDEDAAEQEAADCCPQTGARDGE